MTVRRKISDTRHPLWRLLTLCVMLSFLTAFLWINASHFDATELKVILGMALTAGGWEGFKYGVSRNTE